MADNPPYLVSPGSLTKALEKIKSAATPARVTTDFVTTVLGFKGGNGAALIPFFKRVGLVSSDGSPTELYNQFRNPSTSKKAAAQALTLGYKVLYDRNEYVHKLSDDDLKGLVVETTGLEGKSPVVRLIVSTFKNFRTFCNFDNIGEKGEMEKEEPKSQGSPSNSTVSGHLNKLNLAYAINLYLPATDDLKVYNAIFRSLKENLLSND